MGLFSLVAKIKSQIHSKASEFESHATNDTNTVMCQLIYSHINTNFIVPSHNYSSDCDVSRSQIRNKHKRNSWKDNPLINYLNSFKQYY